MHTKDLANWLAINSVFSFSNYKVHAWLECYGRLDNLFTAKEKELSYANITSREQALIKNIDWAVIDGELRWQETNHHHHCLTIKHTHYPALLKTIPDPPLVLYVKGNLEIFNQMQIAIVGARHASIQGKLNAENFAKTLGKHFIVTSGLARGIDAAAHKASLQEGYATCAIIGSGLNNIYPKEHTKLATEISGKGVVVSEFPLNTPPYAKNFPRRNRIIAAVCKAVLVVEAALKSGSLITAYRAIDYGRDVYAIPGSIHHPSYQGCHKLIQEGAKLTQSPEDILIEHGVSPTPKKLTAFAQLTDPETTVLQQISDEITPIDMIILRCRLTASEVCSILLALELKGYIKCTTGGYLRVFASR